MAAPVTRRSLDLSANPSLNPGDRAVFFIERFCTHVKGELGGKPFLLEAWQRDYVRMLFGTLNPDGTRRYRTSLLALPRKQGKSTLGAALALYALVADQEPGAEVYSCAGSREQAKVVFDIARGMIDQNETLSGLCKPYRNSIIVPKTHSHYKATSAEAGLLHGLNSHAVIFDELHTQPDEELWRVMTSSCGARRQPIVAALTTAGVDKESICYRVWEYALRVRRGDVDDPTFLPVIYAADEADDWTSPETHRKANPSYGVSVKEAEITQACKVAQEIPTEESSFKTLRLNMWVGSMQNWLRQADWEAGADDLPDDLQGRPCYAGLDLSASFDTTSLCCFWPPELAKGDSPARKAAALWIYWLPEDQIKTLEARDHVPYTHWSDIEVLRLTPGKSVKFDVVRRDILHLATEVQIKKLAVDRWQANQLSQELDGEGVEIVKLGQGYGSLSEPSKFLEKLIAEHRFVHGGNPLSAWQASCCVVARDAAGNIKPAKDKSRGRIDGIFALVNAIGSWLEEQKEAELDWTLSSI